MAWRKAAIMTLEQGQPAPDFTLPTQQGDFTLSAHRGRPVVIYFYPKDNTPGCTRQACGFQEALPEMQALEAQIVGISKDSVASHRRFAEKHGLDFPLGADTDGAVCEAYGVFREKMAFGKTALGIVRSTFLIDSGGRIARIWSGVKVPGHVEAVAAALRALAAPAG